LKSFEIIEAKATINNKHYLVKRIRPVNHVWKLS
jgi:hypothetical protein